MMRLFIVAQGLSDARVTLTGEMTPVPAAERDAARSLFLKKHPNCFYVDFGDFDFYRMDKIVSAHLIGGFGRVAQVWNCLFVFCIVQCTQLKCSMQLQSSSYLAAHPDPIAPFSGPVATHMNADHSETIHAMVRHYAGISVSGATMSSMDSLGMDINAVYNGMSTKVVSSLQNVPLASLSDHTFSFSTFHLNSSSCT